MECSDWVTEQRLRRRSNSLDRHQQRPGRIEHSVDEGMGRVANAGNISVSLTGGMKRAVGSGRLTGTSGSGTWRGTMRSGTWTAQRI
jgi:hypothetical protein